MEVSDKISYNSKNVISGHYSTNYAFPQGNIINTLQQSQPSQTTFFLPGAGRAINPKTFKFHVDEQWVYYPAAAATTPGGRIYVKKTFGHIYRITLKTASGTLLYECSDLGLYANTAPYRMKKNCLTFDRSDIHGSCGNSCLAMEGTTGSISSAGLANVTDKLEMDEMSSNMPGFGGAFYFNVQRVYDLSHVAGGFFNTNKNIMLTEILIMDVYMYGVNDIAFMSRNIATTGVVDTGYLGPFQPFTLNTSGTAGTNAANALNNGGALVNLQNIKLSWQQCDDDEINFGLLKALKTSDGLVIPIDYLSETKYSGTNAQNQMITHNVVPSMGIKLKEILYIPALPAMVHGGATATVNTSASAGCFLRYNTISFNSGTLGTFMGANDIGIANIKLDLSGRQLIYYQINNGDQSTIKYNIRDDCNNTLNPVTSYQQSIYATSLDGSANAFSGYGALRYLSNNFHLPYSFEDNDSDDNNAGIVTVGTNQQYNVQIQFMASLGTTTISHYIYTTGVRYLLVKADRIEIK